jgi:bromodomain adjacent to zinc finger domain protein 1A
LKKKNIFISSEFFERVMLTNSVIWQCALTGRPDLTFAEALESEKTARKLLRQFPSVLRGPVILIASQTKRSALKELVDDVFNLIKDIYFKDEQVDVMNENGRGYRFVKILEILTPEDDE